MKIFTAFIFYLINQLAAPVQALFYCKAFFADNELNGTVVLNTPAFQCRLREFCCGTCVNRYCCNSSQYLLNQNQCENNIVYDTGGTPFFTYGIIYSLLLLPLLFSVLVIIFCCYKVQDIRAKRRNRRQENSNAIPITISRHPSLPDYNTFQSETNKYDITQVLKDDASSSSPPPYPGV